MLAVQGLLVATALLALLFAAARARQLCVMSVRHGRLLVMRGALPSSLFEGLADVVARAGVRRATIRVLRDGDRARLEGPGLDARTLQRARNVLGTYTLARLQNVPRMRRRNLGQLLGVAWLGWWLHDRERP